MHIHASRPARTGAVATAAVVLGVHAATSTYASVHSGLSSRGRLQLQQAIGSPDLPRSAAQKKYCIIGIQQDNRALRPTLGGFIRAMGPPSMHTTSSV